MTFAARTQFDGVPVRVVTVTGVGLNNRVMVKDAHENEFEVTAQIRVKGSGMPAVGERWMLIKRRSMWTFDTLLDARPAPVITGDITGLHPVMAQILSVLASNGIVLDQTTGSDMLDLNDATDPSGVTADMTESLVPDIETLPISDDGTIDLDLLGSSVGDDLATTTGRDADDGGVRTADQTREEEIKPTKNPTNVPLTLVTYMQGNQIGPQRVRSDLVRLSKTRADIVALQGADPSDRDSIYANWDGWDMYRPSGHAKTNTIAWREGSFAVDTEFSHPFSTSDGIDRCVNGVRLQHLDSQMYVTVLNTQLEPWAAFPGAFLKTTGITNRVATFNVNQFNSSSQIADDLKARMPYVDVLMLQETVDFDLKAFANDHDGWSAYQVNPNSDDGKANTSILYRTALGPPQAVDIAFVGDAVDTRERYLVAVKLGGVWYVSVHIFPDRDSSEIPSQISNIADWADAHSAPQIWGLDKNQCSVSDLETATHMTWHGIDIDGFLTQNGAAVSGLKAYPSGHSDHDGVRAEASSGDNKSPHVANFKSQMSDLLGVVKAHQGSGPLFLCGNFNVDYRRDHRLRNHGLPYVSLKSQGMRANWDSLGLTPPGSVGAQTYYDQIYMSVRHRTVTPEFQKTLRGYYGPHRPVMVTYRLHAR